MRSIALILAVALLYVGAVSLTGMTAISAAVLALTLIFMAQGALSAYSMLYTWTDHMKGYQTRPPKHNKKDERVTFTLMVPVRHEEKVIGDTLKAMARINYPKELYEVLVIVRADDTGTIEATKKAIREIAAGDVNKTKKVPRVLGFELDKGVDEEVMTGPAAVDNISLVVFDGGPYNKPRHLNVGLDIAQNAFVGVFDAEDEPHPDILNRVEAYIRRKKVDAVQSGVQLVNVDSRWFTAINCLEYYYWFKSVLPFFATLGAVPLGGNTVFMRTRALHSLGGWDEKCLTEDADIGIRLSSGGYKIGMMYDATLSTLEEAPVTHEGFIKQRSRWDQGYMQVLLKGDWARIPKFRSEFMTFYLLFQSLFRSIYAVGIVLMPLALWSREVPMWLAILSFMPMQFLMIQWGMNVIGLIQMRKEYNLQFSNLWLVWVIVTYYPYQFMLTMATIRGVFKFMTGSLVWDKTAHGNVHRLAYAGV